MPKAGVLVKRRTFGTHLPAAVLEKGKTKNSDFAKSAKAQIRKNVIQEIGTSTVVLDLFAGEGEMYRAAYKGEVSDYVGCDLEWPRDDRLIYVCDNRRLLRAIDLGRFNVFDLDHYGSPWEHVMILAKRRPVASGERIGVVITEGSNFKVRMGGLPAALQRLAGLKSGMAGAGCKHDEIIEMALAGMCEYWGVRILRRWHARSKTGSHMRYIGMVVEGR